MERCAGCGRELAATWKFCLYCGRPQHLEPPVGRHAIPEAIPATTTAAALAATPAATRLPIPAAIRPELDSELNSDLDSAADSEAGSEARRKYDAPFWVGVGMGVLGAILIVYAAIQIYSSYG